ncbi:hypothetical protein [Rhodopseudomonas sp. BR0M22]|uniref:hypothetical protein n=1 Tax=Rhodopseudomonas sp. BR0M22 TaxID=2269369 RepID=UPI0013DF966F|nr:hypothetical protein [Rhodopseudomonas sp. BR0M22]MCD0423789.1 hypothetical protein [Rubrivivax sp. JA1024]NEW94790.1 hypothetical protein [Rhodopseudomonas sp. BR0M22]
MKTDWRISTVNGVLLAAYIAPTWLIVAYRLIVSPIHALYDRPNISVAIFVSDHLHLGAVATMKMAWLLALGKLTVAGFLLVFSALLTRPSVRLSGGCNEALAFALTLGSVISFASMVMASQVAEPEAMRLHATELLLFLGTAILMLVEPSTQSAAASRPSPAALQSNYPAAAQRS